MIIQHNIPALNSYNRLATNNKNVASNLKKLSSGYKINSAADNAAGLAISEKMRAQITGLEACQQNAKDGISLVQTAEGALTEVHSMLNRMVELSTLASNGTYSDSNRAKYQNEIQELQDEIDRIADSTNFNGIDLLNGNLSGGAMKTAQAQLTGSNVSTFFKAEVEGKQTIKGVDLTSADIKKNLIDTYDIDGKTLTIDWSKGDAKKLQDTILIDQTNLTQEGLDDIADKLTELFNNEMKAQGVSGSVKITADATTGMMKIQSQNNGSTSSVGFTGSNADAANDKMSLGGYLFGDKTKPNQAATAEAGKKFNNTVTATDKFTMTINGTTVEVTAPAISRGTDMKTAAGLLEAAIQGAVAKYNAAMVDTGLTEEVKATDFSVEVDKSGGFKVTYSGKNAEDVTFSFGEKTENGVEGTAAKLLGLTNKVSSQGVGGNALSLQIGDTADEYNRINVSIQDCHAQALGVGGIDVTTEASAAQGISKIKEAIDMVSDVRAKLGATQNRLDHTLNNLETTTENLTDAESRIRDTDMAKEMMQYTKNNILVQSSQAMLAQANQLPQGVLQLLQ